MGRIIVMKVKDFLHAEYLSFTGETSVDVVVLLLTLQNTADLYCGEAPGLILEAETHRGDLSVGIGTGDHLYWNVYTKDTFHVHQLLSL